MTNTHPTMSLNGRFFYTAARYRAAKSQRQRKEFPRNPKPSVFAVCTDLAWFLVNEANLPRPWTLSNTLALPDSLPCSTNTPSKKYVNRHRPHWWDNLLQKKLWLAWYATNRW